MIPSRLNLLSPEKRRHLHSLSNFQFIKNILEVLLLVICIGGIVLLGGQSVLQNHLDQLTASLVTFQSQHTESNQQIKEINSTLIKIEKIQKEYQLISPLIPQIVSATPNEIILKSLVLDPTSRSISLAGHAPNRDTLLLLQKQLLQIDWITTAEIPISQLTEKENIDFAFSAQMIKQ